MKKTAVLFVLLALLLAACGVPATPASDDATEKGVLTWQEQYDLGMRYLSEENYEEAIIAFTAAIEIDPKKAEAFYGRGQAYFGAIEADAVESLAFPEDVDTAELQTEYCYKSAMEDLERAIEIDPTRAEYYDAAMRVAMSYGDIESVMRFGQLRAENTDDGDTPDLYEAAVTGYALMDELAAAFESGNDESVFALMWGREYESLLRLQEYMDRPILREYNGKMLGIYRVNANEYGDCMLYYGDFSADGRNGNGAWYGYNEGNNYASHGDWRNDAPNGSFETKEWSSHLAEDVVYRLVSGEVSDGLWDGEVIWAFDKVRWRRDALLLEHTNDGRNTELVGTLQRERRH